MGEIAAPIHARRRIKPFLIFQIVVGVLFVAYVVSRLYTVLVEQAIYGPDTWLRFAISGMIIGSVYALIAVGYTQVYGILRMINFAHGDVFMVGMFGGFLVFEGLGAIIVDPVNKISFMDASPTNAVISIVLAFAAGMVTAMATGLTLERLAYRPLRHAPRLIPLISAIGASIFLEEAARLVFGPQSRTYTNPDLLTRNTGWNLLINDSKVLIPYTGAFTFALAVLIMVGLNLLVQRTSLGRAMRAVSEDKQTAALMGINVDRVISQTFMIAGTLAGAGGVMWGLHYGQVYFFIGFIPGIKAFTAAVLGGIGNIPGAMVGALTLGIVESIGPAALGLDFQLKDVIAFSILVLVLIFRPSGILGEVLTEEKV